MSATHAERRSTINHELFAITDEMREAMERARISRIDSLSNVENTVSPDGKNNFRAYDQNQSFFITVTKDKFLDAGHPAALIDTIIERLDLELLYNHYALEGNPAYHPKMMLKILFYGYYTGIMSCRTIWDSVINRADFMYLAAGQVPNFRTINDFRLRHLEDLSGLFTHIVLLCKELDMLDFEHMAVDGQKIQANANYKNSKNLKGIKKEYVKVKEGMERLLKKEVNEYFTEDTKKKRVSVLEKKLDNLESFQKDLEALNNEEQRINMVDPDAPIMTHKDGQKVPSYSHQSAVDGKCGVVTAVHTTQNNDVPEDLLPLVDQSIENTGERHDTITADCGFCDYDVLQKVEEEREEDFYIPDRRFSASEKEGKGKFPIEQFEKDGNGGYECPAGDPMEYKRTLTFDDGHTVDVYQGTACDDCPLKDRCTKGEKRNITIDSRIPYRDIMRDKLKSEEGREIYMKRQGLIEPVHGDDQKNKGWIQHHLRGFKKASAEFVLMRIVTNLALMIKHREKEILAWAGA
jgi:transposase